jgi:hypothetical protein
VFAYFNNASMLLLSTQGNDWINDIQLLHKML